MRRRAVWLLLVVGAMLAATVVPFYLDFESADVPIRKGMSEEEVSQVLGDRVYAGRVGTNGFVTSGFVEYYDFTPDSRGRPRRVIVEYASNDPASYSGNVVGWRVVYPGQRYYSWTDRVRSLFGQ